MTQESEVLTKYALLKIEASKLKAQIDELTPVVTEMISEDGVETELGKFTKYNKTSYIYSNAVKKAKESVKVLEAKEVSEGVAEEKVTQVMSFTANKK